MASQRYCGFPARLALNWGALLLFVCVSRAAPTVTEYSVKAAFLYNFAQFIHWPGESLPNGSESIVVGVFGRGDLPADLQTVDGRKIPGKGRNRVIVLKQMTSPDEIDHCQILLILHSAEARLPEIMRAVDSRSILTVLEDSPNLARDGGVINLIKTPGQRIRFEINIDAAKRANLKIDSPLLNVAKLVRNPQIE